MQNINRVLKNLKNLKKFSIFYFSFVEFVGDRGMKTKNLNKTWIKND